MCFCKAVEQKNIWLGSFLFFFFFSLENSRTNTKTLSMQIVPRKALLLVFKRQGFWKNYYLFMTFDHDVSFEDTKDRMTCQVCRQRRGRSSLVQLELLVLEYGRDYGLLKIKFFGIIVGCVGFCSGGPEG